MKLIDRYLRDVRIARAKKFVRSGDVVLDIGCADGAMFEQWHGFIKFGVGVDPDLQEHMRGESYELVPGVFPGSPLPELQYDAVTMLAVLEHIPAEKRDELAAITHSLVSDYGRIIITVPSPRVDRILGVLGRLRLVDGMHVDEHYGFDPSDTEEIFAEPLFRLTVKEKFQLGLNHLFVFERLPAAK